VEPVPVPTVDEDNILPTRQRQLVEGSWIQVLSAAGSGQLGWQDAHCNDLVHNIHSERVERGNIPRGGATFGEFASNGTLLGGLWNRCCGCSALCWTDKYAFGKRVDTDGG
jgi:hypothetical protein